MSAAVSLPWPDPSDESAEAIAALADYGAEVRADAERRLRGLSPEARRLVESVTARIVEEFLRAPALRLREPDGLVFAGVVDRLFALDHDSR
jgi:hypothetical protein